ncbi:DUF4136 domain-containing protein [Altererythrobacter arenosus]|uniref:DUF4136 domain-containing protein n=1 Tax=Altererythrobacter arenosus TaxID=3032592 RepID=A0ABY8FMC3_9SPHN|nr:DUF4136 domain-containing protein [Altererythrobacter sp. CAU 1644]WFL76007.1 DUF4136 domain-containing protein [Altererythrobacter sp. CAU 1644]
MTRFVLPIAAAALLAGCATAPAPASPVEVTRFHNPAGLSVIEGGTVFIESAPRGGDSLAASPYKAAVARELSRLGYRETNRSEATLIAQVEVDRFAIGSDGERRGPVSVGVGGSTGSYGSGVGVGVGINLGGGRSRERVGTELSVMLRDAKSNQAVWEGRAQFSVGPEAAQAEPATNASIIAEALFRDFPGGNGETVRTKVN